MRVLVLNIKFSFLKKNRHIIKSLMPKTQTIKIEDVLRVTRFLYKHCENQQNMIMKTAPDKQLKNETHWNWFRIVCLSTKNDDCQSPATSDLQAASYLNLEVKWWASNDTSGILNTYVYNLNKRVEKFTGVIRSDEVRRSDLPATPSFVIWWFRFYFNCAIRSEAPL